jgi:hypothetical protein
LPKVRIEVNLHWNEDLKELSELTDDDCVAVADMMRRDALAAANFTLSAYIRMKREGEVNARKV